ncbi:MAG: CheR family methyltransferase, partial [Pseudomonadota bacterium]
GADKQKGRRIANAPIEALGSDLSRDVIEQATAAIYPKLALMDVPSPLQENWCQPVQSMGKDCLSMGSELRGMVRFEHQNLLAPWSFSDLFDVIFCRNVMIYFDNAAREELALRFAQHLRPGGTLYIGHSEQLMGEACHLFE